MEPGRGVDEKVTWRRANRIAYNSEYRIAFILLRDHSLRGFLWTQPQKTAFRVEFLDKNCTIDRVRQNMIIWEKLKKVYSFEMAAILLSFLSSDCAIPRKFKKKTFPKPNFNEIWLKVADHQ